MLGAFYAVGGALLLVLDGGEGRKVEGGTVLAAFGALALSLLASGVMFEGRVDASTEAAVLAGLGTLSWAAFDRTPQGLGFCLLLGILAPVCEILILDSFPLWHYPR